MSRDVVGTVLATDATAAYDDGTTLRHVIEASNRAVRADSEGPLLSEGTALGIQPGAGCADQPCGDPAGRPRANPDAPLRVEGVDRDPAPSTEESPRHAFSREAVVDRPTEDSMHTHAKRLVSLPPALLLSACLLAGCGDDQRADDGRATSQSLRKQEERARRVADAWRTSAAAASWSRGYYPMAGVLQKPESGWRSKADERAYRTRNFVLRGDLPTTAPGEGEVDWGNGDTLTRPLTGAKKAYQSFALDHSDGPRLTVKGARLGTTTIVTSRGRATVAAWLFTLEGYDAPLKRVAVIPSKLPRPPIGQARQGSAGGLQRVTELAGTAMDGRSITVRATHGACDDGPVVKALETDESVVLYASIAGARSGPCTAEMIEQSVGVKLQEPLGDRILLDALTGRPVPYGEPNGLSPNWT
ncbi:hypothetical protein [Streptomyces sp. NPDC052701]|uniref:hypothetical protein n=1 Tax=Streptomyces sp. NPDC052701 TaxID=3155533 RepID=UPI003435D06D